MSERDNIISGQIVLRDASDTTPGGDDTDRKMMLVVGVIAVPKNLNLKGEHKYTIAGNLKEKGMLGLFQMVDPDFGKSETGFEEIDLKLFPETGEDISNETTGQGLGGIITGHRRWRI